MIIFRKLKQKEFGQIIPDDGFGGLKGRIRRLSKSSSIRRNLSSYKQFGPWNIVWGDNALNDSTDSHYYSDQNINRIEEIIKWIKFHPYGSKFGQHPLWEFFDIDGEFVVWSADITEKDRLVYCISKVDNTIIIINCKEHVVIDSNYYKRN